MLCKRLPPSDVTACHLLTRVATDLHRHVIAQTTVHPQITYARHIRPMCLVQSPTYRCNVFTQADLYSASRSNESGQTLHMLLDHLRTPIRGLNPAFELVQLFLQSSGLRLGDSRRQQLQLSLAQSFARLDLRVAFADWLIFRGAESVQGQGSEVSEKRGIGEEICS